MDQSLNQVIDYIEKHLADKIEYAEIAEMIQCPIYYFQKFFLYLTGITLNDYIRLRRLSAAAVDLQKKDAKVIDTALKYGYNSPTAFNRAFKQFHGIAPSAVKKGRPFKSYPPVRFSIAKQGGTELKFRIEYKEAFQILGIRCPLDQCLDKNFERIPMEWQKAADNGRLAELIRMNDCEPKGLLGIAAHHGSEWKYYIAAASACCHHDFEACMIPASMWAVFTGRGTNASLQALERRVITEWLPTSGYQCADVPDVEYYIQADPADAVYEYWLPIQ